jgi:hypothetical protein
MRGAFGRQVRRKLIKEDRISTRKDATCQDPSLR